MQTIIRLSGFQGEGDLYEKQTTCFSTEGDVYTNNPPINQPPPAYKCVGYAVRLFMMYRYTTRTEVFILCCCFIP